MATMQRELGNKMAQVRLSKRYTTEIIHLRSCRVVVVVVVYVQDDARGEITGHKNTRSCLSAWKPEVSGLAFAFARRKTVRMWTFHKPQWLKFSQLNVTFLDLNPQSIVLRLQTSNNVCDKETKKKKENWITNRLFTQTYSVIVFSSSNRNFIYCLLVMSVWPSKLARERD